MVLALKYDVTTMVLLLYLNITMVLPHLYHGIDVAHGNTLVLNRIIHSTMVMHNYDEWYQKMIFGTIFIKCALPWYNGYIMH